MPIYVSVTKEDNIRFHRDNVRIAKEHLQDEIEKAKDIVDSAIANYLEAIDWAKEERVDISDI
jgi:hypothetical protein